MNVISQLFEGPANHVAQVSAHGGRLSGSSSTSLVNEVALTIVMHMQPLVALPDKTRHLQRAGSIVSGLFVVVSGSCLYEPTDASQPGRLIGKGCCFGNELLSHARAEQRVAVANVYAREICELMYLPTSTFEELLASTRLEHQPLVRCAKVERARMHARSTHAHG